MAKKVNIYGIIVAGILGVMSLCIPESLGLIFTKDQEVIRIFTSFFYLVVIVLPVNALAFVGDGIFKGLGETSFLRNVLLGSTFLGFLPVLLLGRYLNWKLPGIWVAITVWMLIRGIALVIKFKNKYYRLATI